jgi:3-isopropylmalate/(R)-2-methylmalate dehydratase large subunit
MPTIPSRPEASRRADPVLLRGRVLFLTEDPALVRRQLDGGDLGAAPTAKLRDDISTDEITPAYVCYYFDETLGEFPYVGFTAGGERPIARGDVKRGGFVVSVSGKRRGKGSSREAAPYAEWCAGIRLVVAENIERIYRQNCHNLGLLTTTDFGILERIQRGEAIPLAEFTAGTDAITRQIIERGGLYAFNLARLAGEVDLPAVDPAPRALTLAEKIFAAHWVADAARGALGVRSIRPGDAGFARADLRFSHEYVTPMAAAFFHAQAGRDARVADPGSVLFFRDHLTFLADSMTEERKRQGLLEVALQLKVKQEEFAAEQGIRLHGELPGGQGSEAICHSKVLQDYALPGQLIIGSDSHTPHSGAVGCLAFGVGTTDIFNSWITRDVQVKVPPTVRVLVRGERPAGITAKDFMLAILAHPYVRSGEAIGKVVEYAGDAVEALDIDERATMTNMAAEVGAFTGIIAPDEKTARFLAATRGMDLTAARDLCAIWQGDPGATYERTLEIQADALRPMVALPGDPGNGIPIEQIGSVRIDIAYGGSCTAGKREDMDMYARVLADGLARDRRVASGVTFWIQFGSQEVKQYCEQRGYLEIFAASGAKVIEPSCGACINAGPGVSDNRDQITVSAINRNFPGRSGPGQMYLASPLTVAASALAGRIVAFEPPSAAGGQAG